jgi:hypothetical protein
MLAGEAVVAIWNGIDPDTREQFYDWHVNEHMPERVGIPGFRRGRRYIAADTTKPIRCRCCKARTTPAA